MRGVYNKNLKDRAISLRLKGWSFPMIEKELGTPRATMSGWFKGLQLSFYAKNLLLRRKRVHLEIVRKKALIVLKKQKDDEWREVRAAANIDFAKIKFSRFTKELLLAMLYLGEGSKRKSTIELANSNSNIVATFVRLMRDIYDIVNEKMTCYLHLRWDQDSKKEINYWSKVVGLSRDRFRKAQFDERTIGSKTWSNYHGVCSVLYNDAKIEKRLTVVQELLLSKILLGD